MRVPFAAFGLSLGLVATPALSDTLPGISEVRLGVLAHDVPLIAADNREGGIDLNAELLFASLDILGPRWTLRPHIGLQGNTTDDTSQVYAGLTAGRYLTDVVWGAASVGGAIHNGETSDRTEDRKPFGSRILFRLALELGVDVTRNASVSVYFDHESNAFLAEDNPGIDNLGIRVGWRF